MKLLTVGLMMASILYGSIAVAGGWRGPFSEEDGPSASLTFACGSGINGVGCAGRYCDNVSVFCASGSKITDDGSTTGEWFSEESKVFKCDESMNMIAVGMACKGRYCDELRLSCASLVGREMTKCGWYHRNGKKRFSEEDDRVKFGKDNLLVGMKCDGKYCDSKQYYVCKTQKVPEEKIPVGKAEGKWVLGCSGPQKCTNSLKQSVWSSTTDSKQWSRQTAMEIAASVSAGYVPPATGGGSAEFTASTAYTQGMSSVSSLINKQEWRVEESCVGEVNLMDYNLYGVWQWEVSMKVGNAEVFVKTCNMACTKGSSPPKGDFTNPDLKGSCWKE
ncbi:MAG: hypothetical protein D3907_01590 [Candidatus Electrothrix sp. AUS3]|nr:hypothetical protein [Candidatus Electrothrix gigas]